MTENLTERAGGEVYFGSQFRGREDMEIEGALSMVEELMLCLFISCQIKTVQLNLKEGLGLAFRDSP